MNKEKFGPGLTKVLTMMCEAVGVKLEDIDFNNPEWYMEHEWTEEQQEEFREKLLQKITKNPKEYEDVIPPRYSNNSRKMQVELFILSYGWKTHYNLEH
jgi:hypothetical protein